MIFFIFFILTHQNNLNIYIEINLKQKNKKINFFKNIFGI